MDDKMKSFTEKEIEEIAGHISEKHDVAQIKFIDQTNFL